LALGKGKKQPPEKRKDGGYRSPRRRKAVPNLFHRGKTFRGARPKKTGGDLVVDWTERPRPTTGGRANIDAVLPRVNLLLGSGCTFVSSPRKTSDLTKESFPGLMKTGSGDFARLAPIRGERAQGRGPTKRGYLFLETVIGGKEKRKRKKSNMERAQ